LGCNAIRKKHKARKEGEVVKNIYKASKEGHNIGDNNKLRTNGFNFISRLKDSLG